MFAGDPCKCKICNVCCDNLYKSGSKRCPVCRKDIAQFVGKNDVEFLKVVAGVDASSGDDEEFKNGLKGRLTEINREHKKLIKSMDWSPGGGNVPPKVAATIGQLRRMRIQDPNSKAVIFSQVCLPPHLLYRTFTTYHPPHLPYTYPSTYIYTPTVHIVPRRHRSLSQGGK